MLKSRNHVCLKLISLEGLSHERNIYIDRSEIPLLAKTYNQASTFSMVKLSKITNYLHLVP